MFDLVAKGQAHQRRNTILRDQLIAEGKIRGAETRKVSAKQRAAESRLDTRLKELGILHGRGTPVTSPNAPATSG